MRSPPRLMGPRASWVAVCLLVVVPAARADQEVNEAIERGKAALLNFIDLDDVIVADDPKNPGQVRRIRGKVTRRTGNGVYIKDDDGKVTLVNRRDIRFWIMAGMVRPEMEEDLYFGGPSALVALALINAGVEPGNEKLAALLGALAQQDTSKLGTYVRSLRACVWSALIERPLGKRSRARYRTLLQEDVRWLMRIARLGGWFSYGAGGGGDHSNTQFANLGLWAGGLGGVEIPARIWQQMSSHWLSTQRGDGGWSYSYGMEQSTPSMTVAGCNSLYITLDRYHSRTDSPYVFFEGARPNKAAREMIARIYASIRRGDEFLVHRPPDIAAFFGYELFGLERLGLASGSRLIGGRDWFEHYAPRIADRAWGVGPVADAFALIFLVHGRAPILFQKLEHGKDFESWNYYHRDLAGLCRYLSRTFERIHRWQRVEATAGLADLQRAPILYISGRQPLELPKDLETRIQEYIQEGGTVFLHADRADKRFVRSAEKLFERLLSRKELRFADLPADHPVYRCHFGTGASAFKRRVPLRGISDGSRICVFMCPVDIAGAWHQDRNKLLDLYRIMANVRVYSVPPYGELLEDTPEDAVIARGSRPNEISVGRLRYPGPWNLHEAGWGRYAATAVSRASLKLETSIVDSASLDGVDVLYICVPRKISLPKGTIQRIQDYLQSGGLLLMDAADGQTGGAEAVTELFEQLSIGQRGTLQANHPIVSGKGLGLGPISELRTTVAGSGLSRAGAPPPILTRTIRREDGTERIIVLACPFDLIAGLDGPFIYNRSGYNGASTRELVDRILIWRWMDLHSRQAAGDSSTR